MHCRKYRLIIRGVSQHEASFWNRKAQGLRSLQIDGQLELRRLLYRLPALQNTVHELGALPK
jgi:hypothetical protein